MKNPARIPDLADLVALAPAGSPCVAALCPDGGLDRAIEVATDSLGAGGCLVACVPGRDVRRARKRLARSDLELVSVHAWVPSPRYRVLLLPVRDNRMLRFSISLHFPGSDLKRAAAGLVASLVPPRLLAPYLVLVARVPASATEATA